MLRGFSLNNVNQVPAKLGKEEQEYVMGELRAPPFKLSGASVCTQRALNPANSSCPLALQTSLGMSFILARAPWWWTRTPPLADSQRGGLWDSFPGGLGHFLCTLEPATHSGGFRQFWPMHSRNAGWELQRLTSFFFPQY